MKTMQAAVLVPLLLASTLAAAQTVGRIDADQAGSAASQGTTAMGPAPADLARWGVLGRQAEVGAWVITTQQVGTRGTIVVYSTFRWLDATRIRATSRVVSVDDKLSYLPETVAELKLLDSGKVAVSVAGKPAGEIPIQALGSTVRTSTESGVVEVELTQEGDRLVTRTFSINGDERKLSLTSTMEPAAGRTLADLHAAVGR